MHAHVFVICTMLALFLFATPRASAQELYVYTLEDGEEHISPIVLPERTPSRIISPQTTRPKSGQLHKAPRHTTHPHLRAKRRHIVELVLTIAPEHGLDPTWVLGVIEAESNFDANVVSFVGAKGLMQLMPRTAEKYGAADPFDPAQNIAAGCALLARLHRDFGGKWPLVLAAYSTGPARVVGHGGVPDYSQVYLRRVTRARLRWQYELESRR